MKGTDYNRLVDRRTGLIRRVGRIPMPPKLPASLVLYGAEVADSLRPGLWPADRAAIGSSFEDEDSARQAAIGEMVERYCGNFVPDGLRRASYSELVSAGENALDPTEVNLYSQAQYESPGFPFIPFTHDLPVLWVQGEDMETGAPTFVPASLVYCNYFFGPRKHTEPPSNHLIYSGIAAGPSREAAEGAALEELIERDATMIWWQSGSPAVGLDVSGEPQLLSAQVAHDGSHTIRYHFVQIPSSFDVPIIGVLIDDTDLEIVALGVACRPNPVSAALKALAESVSLWFFAKGLLDPDGAIWGAVQRGEYEAGQFRPYRPDRRYVDSFRPDYHDIIDLGGQSQLYLDRRMRVHVERIITPHQRVPLSALPCHSGTDRRGLYLEQLRRRGFRAYSVDLTTPDVRGAGFSVVRVVAPGLYGNSPAAFPFLGGRRLYEEPVSMGWITGPLTEETIVRTPLPHT